MKNFKCCSACLVNDVKMFNLSTKPTSKSTCTLGQIFSRILRIPTFKKYSYVCFECARLVCKFQEFKSRCQKAQFILSTLMEDDPDKIKRIIENCDRKILKLSSKLTFSSMIMTNSEIYDENVESKPTASVENKDANMHSIHDSKTIIQTIDEDYNSQSNKGINKNVDPVPRENIQLEENENTINSDTAETIHENDCNDECEMIEEYLESEEDSFYSDTSESPKENNKDLDYAIMPTNENTEDSKTLTTKGNNKISNDTTFTDEDNNSSDTIISMKENNKSLNDLLLKNKNNKSPKPRKKPQARTRKITEHKNQDDASDSSDNAPLIKIIKDSEKESSNKKYHDFNAKFFEGFGKVVLLTPEEAKKELLLRKESYNYNVCPHKCDLCYKGFEYETAYENHIKKHTDAYGSFECDYCHLRYPAKRYLSRHILTCHKRKFLCKLCPYACFNLGQATNHVRLHKGKTYPCKDCDQVFSMPNSLLMHKRIKHQQDSVCEFCGDTFASTNGLYIHKKKIHKLEINKKEGPYCEHCEIHFATMMAWKKHLVLKHCVSNGCKHCGEMFSNEDDLKAHLKKKHARIQSFRNMPTSFPLDCSHCKKTLLDSSEFKSHMTSEHPQSYAIKMLNAGNEKRFVCETCGKAFRLGCLLSAHQRMHTGERPFACAECGARFARAQALSLHAAARHRRLRPHVCCLCGQTFLARSAHNKHMKIHLNIRPHKCSLCEKAFVSPSDLKVHVNRVHNKVTKNKNEKEKTEQEQ